MIETENHGGHCLYASLCFMNNYDGFSGAQPFMSPPGSTSPSSIRFAPPPFVPLLGGSGGFFTSAIDLLCTLAPLDARLGLDRSACFWSVDRRGGGKEGILFVVLDAARDCAFDDV